MRTLLVYGNCQAGWVAGRCQQTARIAEEYEVIYLTDYAAVPPEHPTQQPGFFVTVDIVFCQTAAACRLPAFLSALRADCRVIRFPTLWLKLLWPMYMVDPRNSAEPGHPWGRYPYGDRLALKLLAHGTRPVELAARYIETDLNTIVNLDRFTEIVAAEISANDRKSDVAIGAYILANFRTAKIFGTVNHPTFSLLQQVYAGVLRALGIAGEDLLAAPENAGDVLGQEETPLHPQIISHFKLTWANPVMRWRYRSEFLNLEEYLRAYGEFRPIPAGDPPTLHLARAQQANALGDFPEARRILLQSTITHPTHSAFLHYLSVLLLRRRDLEEAEKVARYGLSQFPREAGLHRLLAEILHQSGFEAEAARTFSLAKELEPPARLSSETSDSRRAITAGV